MQKRIFGMLILMALATSSPIFSQAKVGGEINDTHGAPLVGANVVLQPSNRFGITDIRGIFEIHNVARVPIP